MSKRDKDTDPDNSTNPSTKIRAMDLFSDNIEMGAFVCNWDYTDRELARLLFLAEMPTDIKADDLVGTEIDVVYWICSKIQIPGRPGEGPANVVRSVLISSDDSTVSTLSHGICKSIDLMRRTFGDQPYSPPIRMVVKGVSTGTGSDMLMLVPVVLETKK